MLSHSLDIAQIPSNALLSGISTPHLKSAQDAGPPQENLTSTNGELVFYLLLCPLQCSLIYSIELHVRSGSRSDGMNLTTGKEKAIIGRDAR